MISRIFKTQETGIVCGDTEATLTGELYDGTQVAGTDPVNTVGCKSANSNQASDEEVGTSSSGSAGAMSWMLLLGLGVLGLWRLNRRAGRLDESYRFIVGHLAPPLSGIYYG